MSSLRSQHRDAISVVPHEPSQENLANIEVGMPPSIDLRSLELAQPTDENLFCPICHSLYVVPVKLPCEHVFCHNCLQNALEHQRGRSKACPSCRTPTTKALITPAPKILVRILDDVRVKCPFASQGCSATVPRCDINDHVVHYCGYVPVQCPRQDCELKVERRLLDQPCTHERSACTGCGKEIEESDSSRHRRASCSELQEECSGCKGVFPASDLESHTDACMNSIVACSASKYGCRFSGRRMDLPQHENACPLTTLGPMVEKQNQRLDEHERAMKHLKIKNEIYEEGLTNVQETLRDSLEDSAAFAQSAGMTTDVPPFESQAAHLLDLHEALQSEMQRISTAVSDLDAKLEVTMLNQTLRANEEKLHRDAMEGQMRKQLQWLVSAKLQASQRTASVMKQSATPTPIGSTQLPAAATGTQGNSSRPGASPWGTPGSPVRRLSDSSRSETKL